MECGCNETIRSWYGLENYTPKDPFDLIAYASLGGVVGIFERSSNFLGASPTASPLSLADGGNVQAWEADNQQMVADAEMWTMQNKMVNVSTAVPPPLHKLAFVRGGIPWKNTLLLDVGAGLDYIELSFLQNAGTRGDAQGTVPVIRFDGPISAATIPIEMTFKRTGLVSLGLKTVVTSSSDEAMFELDLQIV